MPGCPVALPCLRILPTPKQPYMLSETLTHGICRSCTPDTHDGNSSSWKFNRKVETGTEEHKDKCGILSSSALANQCAPGPDLGLHVTSFQSTTRMKPLSLHGAHRSLASDSPGKESWVAPCWFMVITVLTTSDSWFNTDHEHANCYVRGWQTRQEAPCLVRQPGASPEISGMPARKQ